MYDLVIKNGLIIDGSGNDGYVSDVAIKDGKIVAINKNIEDGKTEEIVKLLPEDIVADADAEADSLESFPFISGLDDSYKANVDAFQALEVELGILNQTVSHESIYWEA